MVEGRDVKDSGSADSHAPHDTGATVAYIVPGGLAAVILGFAIFFFFASLTAVVLRTWIRARSKTVGWDDGMMLTGLVLFLADVGIVAYDTFQGLGTIDDDVPMMMQQKGIKFSMIWQLFYVTSLLCIKASICVTLLRIAIKTSHRIAIYITVGLSVVVTLVGFVGILCICRPIEGNWVPGLGECASRSVLIALNYLISVGAIVTDWACAIIPVFILWDAQMKRKVKISVGIVLGIGSLASLSTFARLPYLKYYGDNDDYLYHIGFIVFWSVFEGGIGLIAGSLPMLRMYFKRWIGSSGKTGKTGSGPLPKTPATHDGSALPPSQRWRSNLLSANRAARPGVQPSLVADDRRDWERLEEVSTCSKEEARVRIQRATAQEEFELEDLGQIGVARTTQYEEAVPHQGSKA